MRQMRSRKPAKRPTRVRLIMLCVGAAFFGIFFLTVLVQAVRGYSALKTGLGYLPLTAGIMVGSGAAARLVPRVGTRSVLLAGARLRLAALLAVAAWRARQLPRRGAGSDACHRRRPRPAVRAAHPRRHVPRGGRGVRCRPAQHRPASRRADQARRARHRRLDRRRRQPWSLRSSELMPVLSGPGRTRSARPGSRSCPSVTFRRVVSLHDRRDAAAVTRARLVGPREDAS